MDGAKVVKGSRKRGRPPLTPAPQPSSTTASGETQISFTPRARACPHMLSPPDAAPSRRRSERLSGRAGETRPASSAALLAVVKSPDRWCCVACNSSDTLLCVSCARCFCAAHFSGHSPPAAPAGLSKRRKPPRNARSAAAAAAAAASAPAPGGRCCVGVELSVPQLGQAGGRRGGARRQLRRVACFACLTCVPPSRCPNPLQLIAAAADRVQSLGGTAGDGEGAERKDAGDEGGETAGGRRKTPSAAHKRWRLARSMLRVPFLMARASQKRQREDRMRLPPHPFLTCSIRALFTACFVHARVCVCTNTRVPVLSRAMTCHVLCRFVSLSRNVIALWKNAALVKCFITWKRAARGSKEALSQSPPPTRFRHQLRCGLRNLGNTCYLNAVLQSLARLPGLLQLLRDGAPGSASKCLPMHQTAGGGSGKQAREGLSRCLVQVFHAIGSGSKVIFSPDTLLSLIWELHPPFRGPHMSNAVVLCSFLTRLSWTSAPLSRLFSAGCAGIGYVPAQPVGLGAARSSG